MGMPYMIQYIRHLHDKVEKIDDRTAPPKEESTAEADSAAMYGAMGMMMNDTLMITNTPNYGMQYTPNPPGSIPDPYAQPQYGMGYGQPQPGYEDTIRRQVLSTSFYLNALVGVVPCFC